jgi:DNA polymerase
VSGDLRPWLEYLREIGVRELSAPARGRRTAPAAPTAPTASPSPAARSRRTPPAPSPRVAAAPAPRVPGKAADGAGLFAGFDGPPPDDKAGALARLRDELGDCTRCKLHAGRTNIVFGVGSPGAKLMFVGEGPGADEDLQGEPFVGRAGKKLDEMIVAIGLTREQVYIANVVKCRPPQNRDPERDEIETCSPFLMRQIEIIRPRVIVTLGSPATRLLLDTRVGITRLRGNWHDYRGIPVMPTFHPAYLLRAYTKENRRKVWDDLQAARARIDD